MRLTRPNPCRRPRWMLSPGVLQGLAEVVAAGFREGPDCLGQPRTERATDGSLPATEGAAADKTSHRTPSAGCAGIDTVPGQKTSAMLGHRRRRNRAGTNRLRSSCRTCASPQRRKRVQTDPRPLGNLLDRTAPLRDLRDRVLLELVNVVPCAHNGHPASMSAKTASTRHGAIHTSVGSFAWPILHAKC